MCAHICTDGVHRSEVDVCMFLYQLESFYFVDFVDRFEIYIIIKIICYQSSNPVVWVHISYITPLIQLSSVIALSSKWEHTQTPT